VRRRPQRHLDHPPILLGATRDRQGRCRPER
jgi:hypothetical protein